MFLHQLFSRFRPSREILNNFEDFLQDFESLIYNNKNILFAGDVNINILKNTPDVIKYKQIINAHGYMILNKIGLQFTTRNASKSIIDHVVSDMLQTPDINIKQFSESDHNVLYFKWKLSIKDKAPMVIKEFKKTNFDIFKNKVSEKLENKKTIAAIDDIIAIISESKNESTNINFKYVREDSYSWITSDILNLMEKRDKFYWEKEQYPESECM